MSTLHTINSAPAASQPLLEGIQSAMGFIPNFFAVLADSPAALEAYNHLAATFGSSDLDATEQQIVSIEASRENGCTYCVAAHTTVSQMTKVDADIVTALRDGTPLACSKHEALRTFTNTLVNKRGHSNQQDLEAFYSAGYSQKNALAVILGVSMKTLTNYTNNVLSPELDAAFQPNAWEKSCCSAS